MDFIGNCVTPSSEIPEEISAKDQMIPGKLRFTHEHFTFEPNADDDQYKIQFAMEEIESEKMCNVEKILFITVPQEGGEKKRLIIIIINSLSH